ncbi:1382_t:CDS:2 [Cetraspora pellucida]|uniref:1382_t:CDS:1 n=1 Tax=Cetraspora pellucida TaxID=1433469 RepID=A0ACA9KNW8_9GLOM|nr:1382_t:CDS:2 [Cetraspora pellucida]
MIRVRFFLEVINLIDKDNEGFNQNETEANFIYKYKADFNNNNRVAVADKSNDYYKIEEINYINDWA